MTARLTLRTAVLAAVAAGAVLVPTTAAFADATPKPAVPSDSAPSVSPERAKAAEAAPQEARPSVAPRGGVAAGDRPAPAAPQEATPAPAVAPRGGVAAGERPAGAGDNSTTAIAGSVAGFALLAGAGTFVLRRRNG
ncbi:hypothetical protein AB0E97_00660 [Streptomyces microflavus]